MIDSSEDVGSVGPAFSQSRVVRMSALNEEDREQMYKFLVTNDVAFFKDTDGSYAANVRMYDPRVIDLGSKPAASSKSRNPRTGGSAREGDSHVQRDGGGAASSSLGSAFRSFPRFLSHIGSSDSVKPKARPIAWLMRHVEEIYDSRYAKDTAELRGEVDADAPADGSSTPFPTFVVQFFSKRYGLRSLIDQTCWDLLASVAALRREHLEAEIFARFLEDAFDSDDLLFFLYVRSVVQKELGTTFRSRWTEMSRGGATDSPSKEAGSGPAPFHLNFREVQLVSRVVFGSESDPLYKAFVALVERHVSAPAAAAQRARRAGGDDRRIEVTQFLNLALVEYHETRPSAVTEEGAGSAAAAAAAAASLLAAAAGAAGGSSEDEDSAPSAPAPPAALLEELGAATHAANGAYIDRLLDAALHDTPDAAQLPVEVLDKIRSEVQMQLEAKVDAVLAEVITATQQQAASPSGAPVSSGKPDIDALAARFLSLLSAGAALSSSDGADADALHGAIRSFCEAVLHHEEIRRSIEPLVPLLVTFSVSKLQSVQ